jgi:predicted RNA-binding protein YlxR (DUF448 family)
VVTRERRPSSELLRLVADAAGNVRIDANGRAGGRGAWVVARASALAEVEAHPRVLQRLLKRADLRANGILDAAREILVAGILRELGRLHREIALPSGPRAVRAAMDHGRLAALVVVPGALGTVPSRAVQALLAGAGGVPIHVLAMTAERLGACLGRGPRAVLAVPATRPARSLLRQLRSLQELR